MQRKVNQRIFAVLAMLTIWITVHTSKIGDIQPDVKVLNRTVNSMMNRLIELESKPSDTTAFYNLYEEQYRFIEGFESSLSFKDTFRKMRAEYGAGYIFHWNERLFTTYFAEEVNVNK